MKPLYFIAAIGYSMVAVSVYMKDIQFLIYAGICLIALLSLLLAGLEK